jgi:hypothetical protein
MSYGSFVWLRIETGLQMIPVILELFKNAMSTYEITYADKVCRQRYMSRHRHKAGMTNSGQKQ